MSRLASTRRVPLLLVLALWILADGVRTATLPHALPWLREAVGAILVGPRGWPAFLVWGAQGRALADLRGARQEKADGCGAAALQWLLGAHHRHVPQSLLWSLTRLPQGGSSARRLAQIGTCFGLDCRVQRHLAAPMPPELPAIVHLRRGHFVVLAQLRGPTARLFDPACGGVLVRRDALERQMSGIVVTCARVEPPGSGATSATRGNSKLASSFTSRSR